VPTLKPPPENVWNTSIFGKLVYSALRTADLERHFRLSSVVDIHCSILFRSCGSALSMLLHEANNRSCSLTRDIWPDRRTVLLETSEPLDAINIVEEETRAKHKADHIRARATTPWPRHIHGWITHGRRSLRIPRCLEKKARHGRPQNLHDRKPTMRNATMRNAQPSRAPERLPPDATIGHLHDAQTAI